MGEKQGFKASNSTAWQDLHILSASFLWARPTFSPAEDARLRMAQCSPHNPCMSTQTLMSFVVPSQAIDEVREEEERQRRERIASGALACVPAGGFYNTMPAKASALKQASAPGLTGGVLATKFSQSAVFAR
jgi:hypothetical protein